MRIRYRIWSFFIIFGIRHFHYISYLLSMKIKHLLATLLLIFSLYTKAQFVTIPDANFVAFLQANYPTCMNGNQMDTTCIDITNETFLDVYDQNIADLTGAQYFSNIIYLLCSNNQLTSLPNLPSSVLELYCSNNQFTILPNLPSNLQTLQCNSNQLTSLTGLPASIIDLHCSNNLLTILPTLPLNLENLNCYSNQLLSLPSLPASLLDLDCSNNQLTILPTLPNNLQILSCSNNQLSALPSLPPNINSLHCYFNQLSSIPNLPTNISQFDCRYNNIICFPIFPNSLSDGGLFAIDGNPFTCLPNYVEAMDEYTLTFPLCVNGDTITNPLGCANTQGVVGTIFHDNNGNCSKDNGDQIINNISVKFYDNNNNFLAQTNSFLNGIYNFVDSLGTFKVEIDTIDKPYKVQCVNPGVDSIIALSSANPLVSDVNFNITCKPGFDIGVQSVMPAGLVFPGQQHRLEIVAGDLGNWYNLNCSAGVSGQVQITISGNVTFDGIVPGALIPSVIGNTFTYTIADFGSINIGLDFGLLFITNSTAQAGDSVCVDVNVTPQISDNDTSNNNYHFCYQVFNSYDPNNKEVYPINVLPGFQDWFTYTIHFQNTGSAPAFNIRLTDTLSGNLDLETFQVINYSHYNNVALNNNLLTFRFPNIMLPDSTTNLEGSKGFVQYRIKPKTNLPLGTQIKNTAYIYFDYNTPIITNTTINEFVQPVSIGAQYSNYTDQLSLYPNPSNGIFNFKLKQLENLKMNTIEVYDMLGQKVFDTNNITISSSSNFKIDLSNQPNGIYFVKVNSQNKSICKKIVKQ